MNNSRLKIVLTACLFLWTYNSIAQLVPSRNEGIDHLVTFSKNCPTKWGDDDFTQTFFFLIPESHTSEFYIRIFDPNIGGELDQNNGAFDSKTKFTVYGGKGCFTNEDAREINPKGSFKSGVMLKSKTFGNESQYDNKWFTFGPFNPLEGELTSEFGKPNRVFKLIAEGSSGNDGNLYKYFLSKRKDENLEIENGKAFTYEYSFRLSKGSNKQVHLYPFIDNDVISVKQSNFDHDSDGKIIVYSVSKNGHATASSGDGSWANGTFKITPDERGKSLDVRMVNSGKFNNDMVIYMVNQYNKPVPFFASPIGSVSYKYKNKFTRK